MHMPSTSHTHSSTTHLRPVTLALQVHTYNLPVMHTKFIMHLPVIHDNFIMHMHSFSNTYPSCTWLPPVTLTLQTHPFILPVMHTNSSCIYQSCILISWYTCILLRLTGFPNVLSQHTTYLMWGKWHLLPPPTARRCTDPGVWEVPGPGGHHHHIRLMH